MSEALLNHHAPDRFDVTSAGLEPGEVNPLTVQVLREIGPPPITSRPRGCSPS